MRGWRVVAVVAAMAVACVQPLQGATLSRRALPTSLVALRGGANEDLEQALRENRVVHTRFDPVMTHVVQSGRRFRGLGQNGCADGHLYESTTDFVLRAGHQSLDFHALDQPLEVGLPDQLRGKAIVSEAYSPQGTGGVRTELSVLVATNTPSPVFAAAMDDSPFNHLPEWEVREGPMRLYVCVDDTAARDLEEHHATHGAAHGTAHGGVVVRSVFPGWRAVEGDVQSLHGGHVLAAVGEAAHQVEADERQLEERRRAAPHVQEKTHQQQHSPHARRTPHHNNGPQALVQHKASAGKGLGEMISEKAQDVIGSITSLFTNSPTEKANQHKAHTNKAHKTKGSDKHDDQGKGKDGDKDGDKEGDKEEDKEFCKKNPEDKDCVAQALLATHKGTKVGKTSKAKRAPHDTAKTKAKAHPTTHATHGSRTATSSSSHAKRLARAAKLEEVATPHRAAHHGHASKASQAHARPDGGMEANRAAAKAKEEELDQLLADLS